MILCSNADYYSAILRPFLPCFCAGFVFVVLGPDGSVIACVQTSEHLAAVEIMKLKNILILQVHFFVFFLHQNTDFALNVM